MQGVGLDIVALDRLERLFSDAFKERAFTDQEIAFADSSARPLMQYALMFAGKEAVYKALGTGWVDGQLVEIVRNEHGKPQALVRNVDAEPFEVLLSLSFEEDYALAIAFVT